MVTRHPAVVEYLGNDYPLFYDRLEDVAETLDRERIRAAHEHLRDMDKADLSVEHFVDQLDRFARNLLRNGAE